MSFREKLRQALGLSDNIRTMTMQMLVSEACFGMFYVVWQPYVLDLKATVPQLGLVQGAISLFTAVGSLLWGELSDITGRKPIYVASLACRFIALLFCITARSWVYFIGFGVFMGLSATWMQSNPATSALLTESVERARVGTAISVYMSMGMIAGTITSPIGGYLGLKRGFTLIFLSCLAGELFNIVFVSLRLRETLPVRARGLVRPISGWWKAIAGLVVPESALMPFYAVSIVGAFSFGLSNSILYGLLVDSYGFNTYQLGLMSTLFAISWGLSQIPMGWLMDRYGKKTFLLLSQVASVIVMAGYILSNDFLVFLLLQILSGLGHSMWIPGFIAMVAERVPRDRRSSALGKLSTLPRLFGVPAPYVGGVIYEAFGFGAPMLVRLVAILVSFSIVFLFVREFTSSSAEPVPGADSSR